MFSGVNPDTYNWPSHARPWQLPPEGEWRVWLVLGARGAGKTRTGAETIRIWARTARRIALVAPTYKYACDVMVDGESGLLAVSPPSERPKYEPSKRQLTWPNGAIATLYSDDEPERLRGPHHDAAWYDEFPRQAAWDMLMLSMRGADPRVVVTTSSREIQLVRALIADPSVVVSQGIPHDNRANLPPNFINRIFAQI